VQAAQANRIRCIASRRRSDVRSNGLLQPHLSSGHVHKHGKRSDARRSVAQARSSALVSISPVKARADAVT
jgi:hypothetical protein